MDYESSGVSVCGKINNLEEGLQPTDNDGTERLRNLIENICNEVDMATFTLRMVRQRLASEHQVDIVKHKALTRALVDEYVVRHVSALQSVQQ